MPASEKNLFVYMPYMIRRVNEDDGKGIAEIYNEYVLNSTASFEMQPVSEKEMKDRISAIGSRYPYWVCEIDNAVVGYCYARPWKERAAYNKTLETTVYLSPRYQGKGIGRLLMSKLIEECAKRGDHVLIACITAENEASGMFHSKLGFKQVSLFESVGIKFGCELDVADYELQLKSVLK